jgi:hypothetical protein
VVILDGAESNGRRAIVEDTAPFTDYTGEVFIRFSGRLPISNFKVA